MPRKEFIGHNIGPDEANKKLNLGAAMYGFADPAFQDDPVASNEVADSYDSTIFGEGWEDITAPSTNRGQGYSHSGKKIPHRPRALKCGYNRKYEVLVIIFRPPTKTDRKTGVSRRTGNEPWIVYEGVDLEMWDELKNYHSTGEWLRYSGVEQGNYERLPYDNKAGLDFYMARRMKQYDGYTYKTEE